MPGPAAAEPPASGSPTWLARARDGLRLRPFDTSTAEGRSKERYRRAALSTLTNMLSQGLGVVTTLLSIRISISYLGKPQYGLWMAIASLLTWASLADFGLGRGAQNHLSEAYANDDRDAAARYVSTGFASLTLIAVAFAVVMSPVVAVVPWTRVLNVTEPGLAAETRAAVAATVACFLAGFPLSLVSTIHAAHQQSYIGNLVGVVGNLASLAAVIVVTHLRLRLPWLILASGGVPVAMQLLSLGVLLRGKPWLRPRASLVAMPTFRALAALSVPMLLFQLAALAINETQTLIIAHRIGLATVADYSVLMRTIMIPVAFVQMVDGPLMPAFRESFVRGEVSWLRLAFFRVTGFKMVIATICALLLPFVGNVVTRLLSGRAVELDTSVWLASAGLLVIGVWNGSYNDLMISVNRLWPLVFAVAANAVVTCTLTFVLAKPLGIFGVMIATPIFSLVFHAWWGPYACRDLIFGRDEPTDQTRAEPDAPPLAAKIELSRSE